MKKFAIIFSAVLMFISCGKSETEKPVDSKYKRYNIESGIIKYKTTINGKVMGSTVSGEGESSLYFKDWGAKELREEESSQTTKISILGQNKEDKSKNHTITKIENGTVYTVDFDNKKINKMENIGMELMKDTDMNEMGKQMLETMGGKKLGNEKFKGYDCEVWDLNGKKQYFYKGIPLKSEVSIMGITTVTEATSVKFDTKVPDSKFKLPDFEVVEIDDITGGESVNEMVNSEEFQEDIKLAKENMKKMEKMSFEEWKKFARQRDPELKQMSDKELRETYDMIQKMSKMILEDK
jgi:hypothetical protein